MLITIPASAPGSAGATSVLDLEPLLAYARQCRPDAVVLMPPVGPDDLPNGAALLAMRNRLEAEALRVIGGSWTVAPDAPVADPAWAMETLFAARALVAALGEAGVDLLTVDWKPAPDAPDTREALERWLERLLEEAVRAEVRLAVRTSLAAPDGDQLLRRLESPCLGVSLPVDPSPIHLEAAARRTRGLGPKLFSVQLSLRATDPGAGGSPWLSVFSALRETGYPGPLQITGCRTPIEFAHAVGFVRGLFAAGSTAG